MPWVLAGLRNGLKNIGCCGDLSLTKATPLPLSPHSIGRDRHVHIKSPKVEYEGHNKDPYYESNEERVTSSAQG